MAETSVVLIIEAKYFCTINKFKKIKQVYGVTQNKITNSENLASQVANSIKVDKV